jgi:hypothetical protein
MSRSDVQSKAENHRLPIVAANSPDVTSISDGLELFHPPGEGFEIRILDAIKPKGYRVGTVSGYFDNPEKAADAIKKSGWWGQASIYHTINRIDQALLARAFNRLIERPKATTADADVTRLRVLPIDIDPRRPAGISSTEAELQHALKAAKDIQDYLQRLGWEPFLLGMSGNGTYLLYRLDLETTRENITSIKSVLEHLANQFNSDLVGIDTGIYNPARILKVFGTVAIKGDPIPDRPHRVASIIDANPNATVVTKGQLETIARPQAPITSKTYTGGGRGYTREEIEQALTRAGVAFEEKQLNGRTIYRLDRCLTSQLHTDGACVTWENGKTGYKCHHNSCADKSWQNVKPILFPHGRAGHQHLSKTAETAPKEIPTADPSCESTMSKDTELDSVKLLNDAVASFPDPGTRQSLNAAVLNVLVKTIEESEPLTTLTADYILNTDWAEPIWAIPNLLPAGLAFLAGKAKLGKSWLALQLALAVAIGGTVLGQRLHQAGPVLYLALEDTPRRLKERMKKQGWPRGVPVEFVTMNEFKDRMGSFLQEGADRLAELIEDKGYYLVIVDTLSRACFDDPNKNELMAAILAPIQALALSQNVALMLIDHHTKASGGVMDAVGDILGGTSKGATLDTAWGLYRERGKTDANLAITGREVEEQNLRLSFDKSTGIWQYGGDYYALKLTNRRQEYLALIEDLGGRAQAPEIARNLGRSVQATRQALNELVNGGYLRKETQDRLVFYEL